MWEYRKTDHAPMDLMGWMEDRLVAELGRPLSRSQGSTWRAPDGNLVTNGPDDGSYVDEEEEHAGYSDFIPLGTAFQFWCFDHVLSPGHSGLDPDSNCPYDDSETWETYMVRDESGVYKVIDVKVYDSDMLF
ncbi:MAG: hypothetical protein AB1714_21490 [Acidobacteriota bacterium]